MKRTGGKRPNTFVLDPAGEESLSEQLANCLRQKIVRGDYLEGDVLPGVRELARCCGTSVRVPMAAFAALTAEGLVKPRPRIGCVVLGKNRKVWRGRIIIVRNALITSYSESVYREALANLLSQAGWRVETVSISYKQDNITPELPAFRRMLTERAELVIFTSDDPRMVEIIKKSGIPYLTSGSGSPLKDGHIGRVVYMWRGQMVQFAADCAAKGIKTIFRVRIRDGALDEQGDFRRQGIAVEDAVVAPERSPQMLEDFRSCGYEAVSRRVNNKGLKLPDLILFCDDYLASGGLLALTEAGLKAPEDVKVVSLTNAGNSPFYPRELTRFEVNGREYAAKVVQAVLQFLEDGTPPGTLMFSAAYVSGQTF